MEGKQSAESIVGICPDQAAHRNGFIFKCKKIRLWIQENSKV